MSDALNVLSELFSLPSLAAFGLGVISVIAWNRIKATARNRTHHFRFKQKWIVWAVVVLVALFVSVKTQETWNCQSAFSDALNARSALAAQNAALDTRERDALYVWINALLNPPPDIKGLPPNDPRGRQYGIDVTNAYLATVADIHKQRADNEAERAKHPLPQPSCSALKPPAR